MLCSEVVVVVVINVIFLLIVTDGFVVPLHQPATKITWKVNKDYVRPRRGTGMSAFGGSLWDAIMGRGVQKRNEPAVAKRVQSPPGDIAVRGFIETWNQGDIDGALTYFTLDCTVDFSNFFERCEGQVSLERRLRLLQNAQDCFASSDTNKRLIVVDNLVADERAVGIKFHLENGSGEPAPDGRGSAFFLLDDGDSNNNKIKDVFWVTESGIKGGEGGLRLLQQASKIMDAAGVGNLAKNKMASSDPSSEGSIEKPKTNDCAPLEYFASWNRRDMNAAVDCFDENVTYDDTAFPKPFSGKEALKKHLILCADCFPSTFTFVADDVVHVVGGNNAVCVKWHVENKGEALPFTRGCSFYELNPTNGKIRDGIDFVEPASFKPGGLELVAKTLQGQITTQEPARIVPLAVWAAYMGIVFFSDGILPGANALALESRTWEEVRDLSLNFFLVSPILGLPFSPVVHPMLEGVFNLLLSWAAMYAGFLSDDRKDKPNLFPMLPAVIGMQLLTSAFLLPYLAIRSTERRTDVTKEDLSPIAKACESPLLGILMGGVGSMSIAWAFLGRPAEFGTDLAERWTSFVELLSIDRVGSSFLVDLAIFGLFQFWLIDDDVKRRSGTTSLGQSQNLLVAVAKYVPFFGMAVYLALRPSFLETSVASRPVAPSSTEV